MNHQRSFISPILFPALFIIMATACNTGNTVDAGQAGPVEGTFENPVLGGDYPDPSIVRVGEDFYMTHSSFEYIPGLLVWHSTDLLNWERLVYALDTYVGSVWAPDLIKHGELFYIYFPAGETNWVVTASDPAGPWSEPVDLELPGFIDPGHTVDADGNRYLYLSKGYMVPLTDDGLTTAGEPVHIYEGWEYPEEWSTECFCLESPKSTIRDGYYYMIVAQGGTAGPATSHMVVAARSESHAGPWVNSPYNPIIHTSGRSERWWSQGHGTLVDDIEGNTWIFYHGYEKGFHTLGRQTLMLPIEWTDDHWFHVPEGISSSEPVPLTPAGKPSESGPGLSDDFNGERPGLQWQFFKEDDRHRISMEDGMLVFEAEGNSIQNSTPLLVNVSHRAYEVSVDYILEGDVTTGLCLFYDHQANVRIAATEEDFSVFIQKSRKISVPNSLGNSGSLRILNDHNEVSFYFSGDGGQTWDKVERSLDATGYNHNVFHQFLSLRAGLYVFGEGRVRFDNFVYNPL
jgi:xylan 1,4-beta-xylosidase